MGTRLYVGNLSPETGEEALRAAFASDGRSVAAVEIARDRSTGASRGFAFVTMATPEDARNAIESLHRFTLDGRTLRVTESLIRDASAPSRVKPPESRATPAPRASTPETREVTFGHRGGASSHHAAAGIGVEDLRGLVHELEVEEDPADPDDEHTEVFVRHDRSDWSITVQRSGRVTLERPGEPAAFLRDVPWERLGPILHALVRGAMDDVRAAGWLPAGSLPAWREDFYARSRRETD